MSAARVFCAVCDIGRATSVDISEHTGIPIRSVRRHLDRMDCEESIRMCGYVPNPRWTEDGREPRWLQLWEVSD